MKKTSVLILGIIIAICLCISPLNVYADSTSTSTITLNVKYGQTEARSMLALVNNFRTGGDAWYWSADNTTQVVCSDLKSLTYDYELEKIAMLRAAEIAVSFSHTRPNGEVCFTAYDEAGYAYYAIGENIAMGYPTAAAAFTCWKEDNYYYSGQGHRRSMLSSDYNRIGIGHVIYNGTHYWVQEFAYSTSVSAKTAANDSDTSVKIEVPASYYSSQEIIHNNSGSWYVKDGYVQLNYSGKLLLDDRLWIIKNGKVDTSVTSVIFDDVDTWWYVNEGCSDISYTGIKPNEYGWWRIENGKVNFNFTGLASNEYGWWYLKDGRVDFDHWSVEPNEYGWWCVEGGMVNFNYTGIRPNEYGWWRIVNGKVDFDCWSVEANEYGWWRIEGGMVNFGFTGLAPNDYGWWYCSGGMVDFNYYGNYYGYTVIGGKVIF